MDSKSRVAVYDVLSKEEVFQESGASRYGSNKVILSKRKGKPRFVTSVGVMMSRFQKQNHVFVLVATFRDITFS